MTPRFDAAFGPAASVGTGRPWLPPVLRDAPGYRAFAERYAGVDFFGGLYRVHDADSAPVAQDLIAETFEEFAPRAAPFAYDWLGRQWSLDLAAPGASQGVGLLLLDVGAGDVYAADMSLTELHDDELLTGSDGPLIPDMFEEWGRRFPWELPLARDRCAAFAVPIFRHGECEAANLEPSDIDAYWRWVARIHITRGLGLSITGLREHERRPV